ncbi:hypothetical protein VIGAN_11069500 [Vigna angularis var. angularis]|uniref:Uncharacterized protein n=1 Tax=Vigna angularis var. angularis TaxID=157739 RepID=A0A0S3T956_PHAAN|nr:hypothetical protein VIGAN_11069500 [Vigna angularis var. angularis]
MMIDNAHFSIPFSTIFQFTLISHQIHNPMRTQVSLFNTEHPQQQTTTRILLPILQPDVASTLPLPTSNPRTTTGSNHHRHEPPPSQTTHHQRTTNAKKKERRNNGSGDWCANENENEEKERR